MNNTNPVRIRGKTWEIGEWCSQPEDALELHLWLLSLPESKLDELGALVGGPRAFSEKIVLGDWVLENGGKLWYQWCLSAWGITH